MMKLSLETKQLHFRLHICVNKYNKCTQTHKHAHVASSKYLWKVAAWLGASTEPLCCSQAVIEGRVANVARVPLVWGDVILCSHALQKIHGTACELAESKRQIYSKGKEKWGETQVM